MPSWTDEQLSAINEEGKNIIVSAGAGSGKTAVLSERVLRKLKQGVNVNELLILTFTNAAAKEMKERIRKKIMNDEKLTKQLELIDSSYITTFDSFSLSTVKKYHYLLNISPNVKIIESSIIRLEKEKIIDEIFNEKYTNHDSKFEKLISDFCIKDDKSIREYIININDKLDLKSNKVEYLTNYVSEYFNDEKINNDISIFENLLVEKIDEIKDLKEELSFLVDGSYMTKIDDLLNKLLNSKNYDEILINSVVKLPALPKGSTEDIKNLKESISNTIKEINNYCKYSNKNEIKEDILKTKDYVEVIIDIIIKLDKKIKEYKYKSDMYEFNDIAIMAINLLKENENVRNEMRESFNEIMVDEYQDTNDIQEEFISLISNNNVYMVGDIKQSIYRFRNANPYIFKNKYDKYSNNENGLKIDLNRNFRSREEVLNNINLIFDLIMDNLIGGANYKESHRMIFGNKAYIEKGNTNQNNNLEIYNYEYTNDSIFKKEEIEAFIIANDIKKKVEEKYNIYDKDNEIIRNCRYDDFVILMDRSTNFELYKKIFEYLNIPMSIYKDEKITDDIILSIMKNLLSLIINVYNKEINVEFKYNFISILRSPLFNMDDNTIFLYFKNKNYSDSKLYNMCTELSSYIDNTSINEFIKLVIDKFDFYNSIITMGDVNSNIVKLDYIINLSDDFSKLGYTIKDFVNFLDEIITKKYDIRFNQNTEGSNSVKIMTIHKSKGLEYYICYYPGLYSDFNIKDLNDRFIYNNKYGIITPIFDEGIDSTIYKELLKNDYIKEEISEKIRLFYVALTRAKEKMILVTDLNKDKYVMKKDNIVSVNSKMKYRSFNDFLISIKPILSEYINDIDITKLNMSKNYNTVKDTNISEYINESNEKITIEELNIENEVLSDKSFSKKMHNLITKKEKDNMDLGTKMHYMFEILDFKNPNIDELDLEDALKEKIKLFFKNDLFNNLKDTKIYKECEFMYEEDNTMYHGIIDLMIERQNEIDIVDYKTSNIDDENYVNQLEGYKKYIEQKFDKKVNIYLYSIFKNEIKKL